MRYAFDFWGTLHGEQPVNEQVRQLARKLFADGHEIHIVSAISPGLPLDNDAAYTRLLADLNVPFTKIWRCDHGAHLKVEIMRRIGVDGFWDDTADNVQAALAAGIPSCLVGEWWPVTELRRVFQERVLFEEYTSLTPDEALRYCEGTESQPVRDEIACRIREAGCANVLEIGCGNGIDAQRYGVGSPPNSRGYPVEYTGFDVSPELIAQAKKRYPAHYFHCVDVSKESLRDRIPVLYHAVFAKSVLEHTPSLDIALAIFKNMLESAETAFVAWHTPPWAESATQTLRLIGHFGRLIYQNTYPVQPFIELTRGRKMKISQHGAHRLWEISR